MRPAALALAWACALWLLWVTVPRAAVSPSREASPATPANPAGPPVSAARPLRNLFEYAARPAAPAVEREPRAVALAPVPLPMPSPTPEPVRVLGIVRQGGRLRALLGRGGETGLVGVGEAFAGYEVLALDEEKVRLRGPGGTEVTVELPS